MKSMEFRDQYRSGTGMGCEKDLQVLEQFPERLFASPFRLVIWIEAEFRGKRGFTFNSSEIVTRVEIFVRQVIGASARVSLSQSLHRRTGIRIFRFHDVRVNAPKRRSKESVEESVGVEAEEGSLLET